MKVLQTIQTLSLFGLLTIGTASCNSSDESDQPYTPLQVYFDPVRGGYEHGGTDALFRKLSYRLGKDGAKGLSETGII